MLLASVMFTANEDGDTAKAIYVVVYDVAVRCRDTMSRYDVAVR